MDEEVDVLVIGAGISGLAFASTYLGVHPNTNLLLVEKEAIVGGTWNQRRLYDHFYTQWSVGFGEFSQQRMRVPPAEDQYWGLFKAKHTTNYLEEFANNQTFAGRSLKDRVRFSSQVINAQRYGDGWRMDLQDVNSSRAHTISARKLILASGLTSIPSVPQLKGRENFTPEILHNIDFGSSGVLADPKVKHITVLGGGKSGADMVYASVKAGKEVAWIVRPSGTGPCTFVDANGKAGFNNAFELASTRAVEALQPSYFATRNWWTNFLHRTKIGLGLSRKLWDGAHAQAVASADYANRPAKGDFGKLVPHSPLFWRNNAAGIVNHSDFYEMIATFVDSYYDELQELEGNTIRLGSGRTIQTDTLLLGTGWQDSLSYLAPSLRAELGLPYPLKSESQLDQGQILAAKQWSQREHEADAKIVEKYPLLAEPPQHVRSPTTESPYRLYNLVVPVDDPSHSFAVVGMLGTTNYFRTGEAQALWITAYFDGRLTLPAVDERKDDVAHFVAWCRRRYLSTGNDGNSVNFDTLRYTDRLFEQLGLVSHLKTGWSYFFSPNTAQDYAGLQKEYIEKYGNLKATVTGVQ
ncbi:FAD-dependent monooxygenase [Lecanosticta acicola]|uniref:L-ornithine N(5)-monooxygenase [NAD(P)H] n=1 Tax=Lecanosticta acicola TaxID=111012 RepID=A0AAI8YSA4_9PEZI|nr:FAD-dependent monooxygenase [Lecanosticta acicola]